jgi:hypothetical protein
MSQFIDYNGKKYTIEEPTIAMWVDVMKLKDILDEQEMFVRMISKVTGIKTDEIMELDAQTIRRVGSQIYKFLNRDEKKLYKEFELDGVEYEFVNVNKISFGQFVDIDSFLNKEESYRIANLNELAAYLYCEKGTKYSDSDFPTRIESFKQLPIKYLEGSIFFLLNLGRALPNLSQIYSKSPILWQMMRLRIVLSGFGSGIQRLVSLQKTKFGKLILLLTSPLWLLLIIFLSLWTSIRRKKNK